MSLYERAGKLVAVVVDRGLIAGVDPDNGIGRVGGPHGGVEVTGRLVTIATDYRAELDVDGRTVTFDVDDALVLDGPSVRA